jgi:hypothetical protein
MLKYKFGSAFRREGYGITVDQMFDVRRDLCHMPRDYVASARRRADGR